MDFKPKQYYKVVEKQEEKKLEVAYVVYFRNADGSLGRVNTTEDFCRHHKDAIFFVKEMLVEGGECIFKKAVLAVIQGGNK